ncbi:MAG: hypothetical protein IID40_10550 [Planctomycetes bacterium]|nr:hypothetical protein [Planctomycetota bacterium]
MYEVHVPQGDSPIEKQVAPVPPADLDSITRRLDRLAENEGHVERRPLIRNAARPRLPLEQLRAETERAARAYTQAVSQVGELTEDLVAGRCSSADRPRQLMSGFLDWIHLDAGLVPALTRLKTFSDEYLPNTASTWP